MRVSNCLKRNHPTPILCFTNLVPCQTVGACVQVPFSENAVVITGTVLFVGFVSILRAGRFNQGNIVSVTRNCFYEFEKKSIIYLL